MSAPSFSSFPASFYSFPEAGSRSKQSDSEPSKRENDNRREKLSKRQDEDQRRRSRSRSPIREAGKERQRGEKSRKKHNENSAQSRRDKRKDTDKEDNGGHRSKRKHKPKSKRQAEFLSPDAERYDLNSHDPKGFEESYKIFFTDTKGDPLTFQYGGIYIGDVPRYHLHRGGRQILGLSESWTVHRRAGKGVEVGLRGTSKFKGLSDPAARSLLAAPPARSLLPSSRSSLKPAVDRTIEFIPLSSRQGRRDPEESYRAITGGRGSDTDSEPDSDSAASQSTTQDEGSYFSPTLTAQQVIIKKLEQELAENPTAVDKWLSLLNHTLSNIPILSQNANKVRSEIIISILSRALAANNTSRLLQLRYMRAGEEIWEEDKLITEWEEALKVGGIEIWMEWLEWRIRKCRKGVDRLFGDVQRIYAVFDGKKGELEELAKLRVFWRMAVVYRDAGFTEKAMAMFQAQAELSFKHPQELICATSESRMSELEEFWDSEMPRIGEENAQGWAQWYALGKPEPHEVAGTSDAQQQLDSRLDPYLRWSSQEAREDFLSLIPAKSFDVRAEADPYTLVLFSDISPFLFEIRCPNIGFMFRLAWLSFLNLQVPGISSSVVTELGPGWDDRWNLGYLTTQSHLDVIFPTDSDQTVAPTESAAGVLVGREREYKNSFSMPIREWAKGVVRCLDPVVDVSKGLRSWWDQADVDGVDIVLVRRVFAQLRLGGRDVAWDEMALAFESAVNMKNSLKLSKSLIATAQGSLLHWAAHAQLERLRGRVDEARKVYQTILISSSPSRLSTGFSILWYDWAELEWLAGKSDEVIAIILRAVGMEQTSSGVALLRAKRKLDDEAEAAGSHMRDPATMKECEAWVKLRALLDILTGNDVTSMLRIFDKYMQPNESLEVAQESMMVASLVMLYRYGFLRKNPMPPTILRERAYKALELYPSNSVIFGIFLEGEKGQGVWGKVRGMLGGNEQDIGKVKDVARRVEEVWAAGWERGRWKGEIERTRSGLASAVESQRTRASPVIWRIYLEFEIRSGDLKMAKKLLFRAIAECPLSKGLYLLAFKELRSVFLHRELDSLADVMVERGLRLRKGLNEIMWDFDRDWRAVERPENGSSEDGGDSEIEQRAEEQRRLMPY